MGGLIPNHTRRWTLGQFSQPANLTTGLAKVVGVEAIYQDVNARRELIISQEITTTDADGAVIERVVSEWDYDTATHAPLLEHRVTYALVYLPKVSERGALIKVEEQWTRYMCHPPYLAQSSRMTRAGYVIYDLAPTAGDVSMAQERGYRVDGNTNRILDSARDWRTATKAVAVVEESTQPQEAVWVDPIETVCHEVQEDFQRILEWDVRYDHLRACPPEVFGPRAALKAPFEFDLPVELTAPKLEASDAGAQGVMLEVTGGEAEVTRVWPVEMTEYIHPERYVVYRRVVTEPSAPADAYRLYSSGTPPTPQGAAILTIGAGKDFAGDPADPRPGAAPIDKPDQVADPVTDEWQQVAEGGNQETVEGMRGRVVLWDGDVAAGGVYEYQAVAIWQRSESPPSAIVTVSTSGSGARTGALRVLASHRERTVEASLPVGVDPGYGETLVLDVPAALAGWPDGPGAFADADDASFGVELESGAEDEWQLGAEYPAGFSDVTTFGSEVAARIFDRYADPTAQAARVKPTVVLPMLERGQTLSLPDLAATITTGGTIYDLTLGARDWRVEGFGFAVQVDGGEAKLTLADIECEVLP